MNRDGRDGQGREDLGAALPTGVGSSTGVGSLMGAGSVEGAESAAASDSEAPDLSGVSFQDLVSEQLRRLGEDPARDGLRDTPARVERSLRWLLRGYRSRVEDAIGAGVFEEAHDSMVLVKDIELYSMCEHHMLPFFGKVHIAYIPDGRIVGLSKLPRIVDVFSRRLQVQERLTEQIAGALQKALRPRGVGVVIEAYHLCMRMRGVEKQNSKAITSAVRGLFRSDQKTREEFLRLVLAPHSIV